MTFGGTPLGEEDHLDATHDRFVLSLGFNGGWLARFGIRSVEVWLHRVAPYSRVPWKRSRALRDSEWKEPPGSQET
jgi:hypothetical protein